MTVIRRLAVLVVLLGLLLAGGASAHEGWSNGNSKDKDKIYPFVIRGDVADLYPGVTKKYTVTLTNTNSFAIVVTDISLKVDDASKRCKKQNLSSPGFHGQVVVPARSTASVKVPISMATRAPDACQGAKFSLTYSGSGRRL
ncbi:MAG: hypothetical protein ACXWEI_22650 [Mycobacterium sp.]